MIFSRLYSFIFFLVSLGLFAGAKPITVEAGLAVREEFVSDNALVARNGGPDVIALLTTLKGEVDVAVALMHGGCKCDRT